jgi:thiamine biosynthesis lipoprotein
MKRRTFLSGALGLSALSAAGAGGLWLKLKQDSKLQSYAAADIAFGTTISIQVLHHDARLALAALDAAMAAVKKIDTLMSLHRADSQLSLLNQHGRFDQPDARFVQVLQTAQKLARHTNGAFDVTVQPLWEAAAHADGSNKALALVDWRKLSVSNERIALSQAGMAITVNGLAQGYGVDLALQALQQHGIQHALLDTGEFGALGRRADGNAWTLGIRDPRHADQLVQALHLDGRRMATSGDYETRFSTDFSRNHIFDPHSGNSPTELASVTVLAPTGLLADGLSTAFMVMGAQQSLALAAQFDQVDLLCIDKQGQQTRSAHFPAVLAA